MLRRLNVDSDACVDLVVAAAAVGLSYHVVVVGAALVVVVVVVVVSAAGHVVAAAVAVSAVGYVAADAAADIADAPDSGAQQYQPSTPTSALQFPGLATLAEPRDPQS